VKAYFIDSSLASFLVLCDLLPLLCLQTRLCMIPAWSALIHLCLLWASVTAHMRQA
jgi:hypothetical protein